MSDNRNIINYYKYWETEAIKADLDQKRNNFSILITNHFNDFNIGSVIRNSNAFLAKTIYMLGRKRFDARGTVGTHHYEKIVHLDSLDELDKSFKLIAFDDLAEAKPLDEYNWDFNTHTVMCFGQESIGLTKEVIEKCHDKVYIKQFGSVRSLNVGCASGIAMYDYTSKKLKT